jgi:hypothetical protein
MCGCTQIKSFYRDPGIETSLEIRFQAHDLPVVGIDSPGWCTIFIVIAGIFNFNRTDYFFIGPGSRMLRYGSSAARADFFVVVNYIDRMANKPPVCLVFSCSDASALILFRLAYRLIPASQVQHFTLSELRRSG